MRKLLLLAALAALGPAAQAQERPDEGGPRHRAQLFISPSGEPFRGGDGLAAWFAQADTDHDGAISREEFRADARRAFKLYDVNGDGRLDGFEIQAYEQERAPEIGEITFDEGPGGGRFGGHRSGGGHGRGRGGEGELAGGSRNDRLTGAGPDGAARYSLVNEPQPLLAADFDVDGKVTLDEWLRATDRRFDRLDKDKSGRLTLASLRPRPRSR